jgi:hypothetical protein
MARKAQRGDRAARQAKVRELAAILRDAEPTPFALQGACTHALRGELCLRGWPFDVAHTEADKLVKAALDLVGAKRPSWHEGQVEFVFGTDFTERTRCANCGGNMPEGRRKYCSEVCSCVARDRLARQQRGEEIRAAERAREAAWSARQPDRTCESCKRPFKPKPNNPHQRFCSHRCATSSQSWEFKQRRVRFHG